MLPTATVEAEQTLGVEAEAEEKDARADRAIPKLRRQPARLQRTLLCTVIPWGYVCCLRETRGAHGSHCRRGLDVRLVMRNP